MVPLSPHWHHEIDNHFIFCSLLDRLCPISPLLAQPENLHFEHLTEQQGLSHNNVWSILQDNEGFMWFGTLDGLNKYDGYSFTVLKPDPDDPENTLHHNIIVDIHEDREGRLWVTTYKVFDRFYQVDSSQTRAHEGSGLGMALAKELAELHQGRIIVESKEGKGTIFTVWLPLGKTHLRPEEIRGTGDVETHTMYPIDQDMPEDLRVAEMEDTATLEAANNNPLILVVEDNADMRHYIRSTLGDQYQVREAANGKEGIGIAQEHLPDLIISDVMMPEMDGFRLCERIKSHELTSHIPVILLTAKADRQSKLAGLETGADDYLSKPFDAEELQLIIRNRIEERRKMRERFSRDITLEPRSISITSLDEKFLKKVLDIIEERMGDENFTIEDLSREASYSHVHLYRKLKVLTDQSPSQFLRTVRLKRAAVMLQQKSDHVTQIAYSVGFNSLPYFNKCFKEQFGMTPGQYAATDQEVK